jgi:serine/threonine protein kinase
MQVSQSQLVEDSVFILQCLRQNARGGRQSALDELEGSVTLEPAAYVAFLERFGYVEVEQNGIRVTAAGERAAKGDADVSRDVHDHFSDVIRGDTQPQIESPKVMPVEGVLGQGPIGHVRAARLGELGLMVALKEYKPIWEWLPWLSPAELARRVRREAQAQAGLGHPCVLPILEVRGDDAQVVMPLAASTLRDKLSRPERMPAWQALRIAAQVAHALAHAHDQGLVHGALKPENVLLDRTGNALVSDFGAARLVALAGPPGGPRVQIELGDVRYRAPEVSASEPAGAQADAFALGTLLHEMLAGTSDGALPADLPAPLIELLDELRHPDPAKRPVLTVGAARLGRLLAPHPLFAL